MSKSMYKDCEIGSIPTNWNIQKLEELANVTGGKRLPKGSSLSEINNGHPYIRVSDMNDKGIQLDSMLYVPDDVVEQISRYRVDKDDLYISVAGTLGLVGKVPDELNGANLTENADRISNIRCNTDFLLYCLKSDFIKKIINSEMTTNAQPKLALTKIKQFPIPVPPLKEQQKIADILSSVDAAIEKTEQVIAKTEEVKKGLMQQLLTKGIGHTEFKQSNLGLIASNWDTKKLKEITQRITDGAHYSPPTDEEGLPIATVENMKGNAIDVASCRRISNEEFNKLVANNCSPRKNDVLLSKDGTIGKVMVYEQDDDITLLSSIAIISVNDNMIMPHYLSYLLQSDMFYWNLNKFRSGSAIKRIVLKDINSLEFPIPTLSEQCKIVEILSIYDKKLNSETNNLTALKKIKLGLMQQLLTGQVRVKV